MRVSRAEALGSAGALFLLLLSSATPARAQPERPLQLIPPAATPDQAPAGGSAAPAAPSPSPEAPLAPPETGGITAVTLAPVDASWVGSLSADRGGLPHDMWQGTARGFVAAALPQLGASASPTLHDLARRLLLSDAIAPVGKDAPDRPSLVTERFERLFAIGAVADAAPLLDQLPPDRSGDSLDRLKVEFRFAANDLDGACRTVQDRIGQYQGTWWARALIACQALTHQNAEAALGLSVLREQKAPADPAFDALIEILGGQRRKFERLPDPTPLRLALLAAAKLPLPAEAVANAGPAALLGWASNDAIPAERRLAAAERAASLNALAPEALGKLYAAVAFKPEEQVAALKNGKLPEDAKSRAILYAAARSSAQDSTRIAALAALLAEAKQRDAFFVMARLTAPIIATLQPADKPKGFAAEAARALLAAGQTDAAGPWIAASDAKALSVVSRLAARSSPILGDNPALLRDGIAALAGRDSAAAPAQAGMLLALLAAFGEQPGGLDWEPLLGPPHEARLPGAALWIDQQQAASGKRVGETVLTTILLAQLGERLSTEPIVVGRAVAGLRAVGLEAEARALAVEAALSAGI